LNSSQYSGLLFPDVIDLGNFWLGTTNSPIPCCTRGLTTLFGFSCSLKPSFPHSFGWGPYQCSLKGQFFHTLEGLPERVLPVAQLALGNFLYRVDCRSPKGVFERPVVFPGERGAFKTDTFCEMAHLGVVRLGP